MPMNYQYTKEADGTFTIQDVELLQLGRWRGSNTGPNGMLFGDAEADAIIEADAEIRQSTAIRPVLKQRHRNPLTGEDGAIIGFLAPFKRAGDRIVASIKGIPETVFREIEAGRAGWLSPDIVPDWMNAITNTTHKLFMRAVSFTGGSLPAMQSLKPLASVEFDSATLEREIQLEHLIGEAQDAAGEHATVSFGDIQSVQEPKATEPEKEVTMAEEITAQALQEKERAFAEKVKQWDAQKSEQMRELKEARLAAAWGGIVGVHATPAEEKAFMDVGMELSDVGVKAHIESYKARPAIEQKPTETKGKQQGDPANEKSFEDRVIERAEEVAEKKGIMFTDALSVVEHSFAQSEQDELAEWRKAAFPVRQTRGGE